MENKEYVDNFKNIDKVVWVRDAEALHVQDAQVVFAYDTTDAMLKAKNLIPNTIYQTKGYYVPGDGGGAKILCTVLTDQPCTRIHVDLPDTKHRLIMLYTDRVDVEQLGVHAGDKAVPGNGKLFNNALQLAMTRQSGLDPFTLHAHGKYVVDATLEFYAGTTPETKTWSGIFNTDFTNSVITTENSLAALVRVKNMQENTLHFGQLNGRNCNSALEIVSLQRYDWSQYLTITADWMSGRDQAVYITNNKEGGWVNDIHFINGVYENGFYIDCPNATDILFKENILNGFYFDHISCEGTDDNKPWFKFWNTWGVQINNVRSVDIAGKFIACYGNCRNYDIHISRNMFQDQITVSKETHYMRVHGILVWRDAFEMMNPRCNNGRWLSDNTQALEYPAQINSHTYDADKFYLTGALGDITLSKNYSDYSGILTVFFSISGGASGRVLDGYGNQIVNITNYAGKYVIARYVPSSGWVVQAWV